MPISFGIHGLSRGDFQNRGRWKGLGTSWGVTIDLSDGKYVLGLVKRAVNGCQMLEFVNLAASLNIRAHRTPDEQLATQTRALLEAIQV
jgi:hypothetical protein